MFSIFIWKIFFLEIFFIELGGGGRVNRTPSTPHPNIIWPYLRTLFVTVPYNIIIPAYIIKNKYSVDMGKFQVQWFSFKRINFFNITSALVFFCIKSFITITRYIFIKYLFSVWMFGCSIVTREPLDRFVSNFDLGSEKNITKYS